MPSGRPTLKPSQIADLLGYIWGVNVEIIAVCSWAKCVQLRCEMWADFQIRNVVIQELACLPVGRPRKLPACAIQ